MLHAGPADARDRRAFFLEYSVACQWSTIRGTSTFATNHFFSIAFRTGRGNLYGRGLDPHRVPTDCRGPTSCD
jgi:hypothetical protein